MVRYCFNVDYLFSFEYGCILSASVKCANVPDCYQWCPNSRNSYMYLGNIPGPLLSGPLIHSLKHIYIYDDDDDDVLVEERMRTLVTRPLSWRTCDD